MNPRTALRRSFHSLVAIALALPAAGAEKPVLHGQAESGAPLAHGATYKAAFERGETSFTPFLGENAPRNFPVAFRLEKVEIGGAPVDFVRGTTAQRAGDAVEFARGSVTERYEVRPEGMEQLFRFDRPLAGEGDLLVRIAVETELAGTETADALEFRGEHGAVRYGRAVVLDAAGRRESAPTTLVAGPAIEIRVGADFLAAARYPVTIDPVITTFDVDVATTDDLMPDVAYDASTDRFLVVHEQVVSASDHDVRAELLDGNGAFLDAVLVDSSNTESWREPKVANNGAANQFLVVAGVAPSGLVRARTVASPALTMGAKFTVGNGHSPDVGGDPLSTAPFLYLVAWLDLNESIGPFAQARTVSTTAVLGSPALLDAAGVAGTLPHVSVSKSSNGAHWNLAWEKSNDIHGARISRTGAVTTPAFPIDVSAATDTRPSASTSIEVSGVLWLVAFERVVGANRNVVAHAMNVDVSEDFVDVTAVAGGLPLGDQFAPSVDSDGRSYTIAYTEFVSFPSADRDIHAATLTRVGNEVYLTESVTFSGSSSIDSTDAEICSLEGSGGPFRRFMAVWGDDAGGTSLGDVRGGLYTPDDFTPYCFPGLDGVMACPCGNPPSATGRGCNNSSNTGGARLTKTGTASVSADTLVFTSTGEKPTSLSIVLQGTGVLFAGTTFGQGVRCGAGTLRRLYTKSAVAGTVVAPAGAEPSVTARSAALGSPIVAGASFQYFVQYRDGTILGGCPSTSTFNATQAGSVIWRP